MTRLDWIALLGSTGMAVLGLWAWWGRMVP